MGKNSAEPYLVTYLHTKGRKLGLPIAGNFELTARCNFNCPMCYIHMSAEEVAQKGRELSAEEWIEIAEAAKSRGMVFALLTGGEPFVRKDFFEIYGAMKKMGLVVSINSNGSMLEGEILEKLIEDPPFRMNISLYGGCNETYQRMCGLPVYDKVLKNIVTLKENGIDVRLNLSITPYNCGDLEKIYEIVNKYQIQVKASSYMYPPVRLDKKTGDWGNRLNPIDSAKYSVDWDKIRFTEEEYRRRAENMVKVCELGECNYDTIEDECSIDSMSVQECGMKCRAGSSSFWMTWDGQMRPCGMMPGPTTYPLKDGFDIAWNQVREETMKIRQPKECVACSKRDICGSCAAVCVAETGAFDGVPEYMCRRTDEMLRLLKGV